MMTCYHPYSPQEDAIIIDVFDNVYYRIRNNAEIAQRRIRNELGIERGIGAINSRKKRIENHIKCFGKILY